MIAQRLVDVLTKTTTVIGLGLFMVCGLLILLGGRAAPVTAAPLATPLSCLINSPITLTLANSPYTANCVVDVRSTLTIEPGVVISFTTSSSQLIIQSSGRLLADGNPTNRIRFTASPGICSWLGIELQSDHNLIQGALFEYARHAIKIEVGSDFNTIEANIFQNNGGCASNPLSGAVVGSTDSSNINDNDFINNNTAIYLSKSTGNTLARNLISTTNQVALSFFPAAGTRSSNNLIASNTIRNAGGFGMHLAKGDNNSVLENNIYGNAAGGLGLEDQDATAGNHLIVRDNDIHHNNGPGLSIAATAALDLGENLILDNVKGVLWGLNNDPGSAVITRNVICRNADYLFRNDDTASVTAARNWWGTNTPTLAPAGEIQGPVTIDPRITLAVTPAAASLPADGVSTTTVTVTLQGGGETVPPRARTITLTTNLGHVSPQVIQLDANGQGTTTYTAGTTFGQATITATEMCGFPIMAPITLTPAYNLAVTKTISPTWAVPGQVVTYTIQYSNTSDVAAAGVVISDVLPALTTFVSDNSGLPRSGSGSGPISWDVGGLPAHTGDTFELSATLSSNTPCNSFITNTVYIAGTGAEPNSVDNRDTARLQVLCGVNLVVVKNDGVGSGDSRPNVIAGEYLTYTISVNNMGNQLATNVVLSDATPANTTFEAARSTPGWNLAGGGVYTINLGNLAGNGGGDVVKFVAQVDPSLSCAITETTNTAFADSAGPELYPPDNTSNEQTPLACNPLNNLVVHKDSGLVCAAPKQTITYSITYSNTGSATAHNVILTDYRPDYSNFLPGGVNSGWINSGGGVFTQAVGSVGPGGPFGPVYFQVQVAEAKAIPANVTAITNVIQISGDHAFTEVISLPLAPDLAVAKNDNIGATAASSEFARLYHLVTGAPPSSLRAQAVDVGPGDVIEYTVVYANNGRATAAGVVLTDTLPLYTTYAGGLEWTNVSGQIYTHTVGDLAPGQGGFLTFRVQVADPLPPTLQWIINRLEIGGSGSDRECNLSNSLSYEQTPVRSDNGAYFMYLPIVLKNFPQTQSPPPSPPPPAPPLAYVSDVAVDPDTNQVFVASPRHNWVYVIDGASDTVSGKVLVGNGPTGLTVLAGATPAHNKVFVAHQYGANNWHPGVKAFDVNKTEAHDTFDGGYAGAAPIKIAANSANNRVYVSNYFDKLAVLDGGSGAPETRLGWVQQKAYKGAYGLDTSSITSRVYLATRDTGELVIFDGHNDRLLQENYIPTHIKPPQPCSLWSVAVNETTGHVFIPCPQLSAVFVLQENQVTVQDLETLGVLEERDGHWALVVSAQAAPWLGGIAVPNGAGLGEEGITVDTTTGRVFLTNAHNNTVVVLQDNSTPAYLTSVAAGQYPQGLDLNSTTQKVYAGNSGSNTVTVLETASPFKVITTISLTP